MSGKRPTVNEDENQLLHLQAEFLKSNQKPAVKIAPKSKFAQLKEQNKRGGISTSEPIKDVLNPDIIEKNHNKRFDAVQNTPTDVFPFILGNIVERKFDTIPEIKSVTPVESAETGFPKVFETKSTDRSDKESIFLKKLREKNKEDKKNVTTDFNEIPQSVIIESPMAKEIHDANIKTLKEMSEEEILAEKAKLEKILNPGLVEFLKAKRKRFLDSTNNSNSDFKEGTKNDDMPGIEKMRKFDQNNPKMDADNECKHDQKTRMEENMDIEQIKETNKEETELPEPLVEVFTEAKKQGWIHMDSLEPEKLKWAEQLPVKEETKAPNEPYNARFDFNGVLLPFKDESLTVDKGLHHHGEEPDRPGYTLQELLQLSRSATLQQRCTALTTLAKILSKSRQGWYDRALNPAPLTALSEKNFFLLLRFSLDESAVPIISATLHAMKELLVSEADEICLARLFGLDNQHKEPELVPVDIKEVNSVSDLKDDELAQIDIAAVAMRSDIVLRIRYILSEIKPPPLSVNASLDILIRLARRSKENALNIATMPNLLNIIVTNFIPFSAMKLVTPHAKTNAYDVPNVTALRLCRVLIIYAGRPVVDKIKNLKVVNCLVSYLSSDIIGQIAMELQIEALRLWKLLLINDAGKDSVSGSALALMSRLQLLLNHHNLESASDLSCEYAGSLIGVAAFEMSLRHLIETLLLKWSIQLGTLSTPTWAHTKLVAQTIISLNDISLMNFSWISNDKLFKSLRFCSNLLSAYTPAPERVPLALPCLNVLTENGEIQPAVSRDSCIPFLNTILNHLIQSSKIDSLAAILSNQYLLNYVHMIVEMEWSFERSWYTRHEFLMLCNLVFAERLISQTRKTEISETIWKLSFDLVSALPGDMYEQVIGILKCIFSHEKFREELLAGQIKSLSFQSNTNYELPNNICERYEQFVSRNGDWAEAAMPKDWLYLPLVNAYTKAKEGRKNDAIEIANVKTILILESTVPQIVAGLSASLRFSRICLVFLCDEVYLDNSIAPVLSKVLSEFLRHFYKKIDISSKVPGLGSFTDLFTALCENFIAHSFGDDHFAMLILTFVAQRHDVHFRKSLWSEHADVLRYCAISPEDLYFPLAEYLYPIESDASLIECYMTSLVRKTIRATWCPVPHIIATHHAAMYLKQATPLAERMRAAVGKLNDLELANTLLNYQPPC